MRTFDAAGPVGLNEVVMKPLEHLFEKGRSFKDFTRAYTGYVTHLLEGLDVESLERLLIGLREARKQGNTVFVIGNGGSAATASHFANDFSFGSKDKDPVPLKVVSLADNLSVVTATANDLSYEQIFLRQLQVYYRPGDRLLVISASGNSPNLVLAAEWVKGQGGKVYGFLGFDGGKLKSLCDAAVVVRTPKGEYGPVEDVHMILDHLLALWFHSRTDQA